MSPDKKCPRGKHDGVRVEGEPDLRDDSDHAIAVEQQVIDRLLEQREVRLVFETAADRALVQRAVGLRAGRPHGGPLARVECPELDSRLVRGNRHRAAQRIDLLDQVPLADAADRGIARHLAERFDIVRQQQRVRPMRAAASAASVPAWPPPTTMTVEALRELHDFAGFYLCYDNCDREQLLF